MNLQKRNYRATRRSLSNIAKEITAEIVLPKSLRDKGFVVKYMDGKVKLVK